MSHNKKKADPTKSKREGNNENLGDDFLSTPWLPPSIEKAKVFKYQTVFRGGEERLDSINVIKAPDLASGVTLYFQFAKCMAVTLFLMSLLSLPALSMVFTGSGELGVGWNLLHLYSLT